MKSKFSLKGHIFISFKTEESKHAELLHQALTTIGYKVWWQENLICAQEWHGEIDQAINSASAIIIVWSKLALGSQWVKHEASQAMALNKYAPIRIEPLEITSPFDRLQATDIINWNGEIQNPGFQNLLVRIEELVPRFPIVKWIKKKASIIGGILLSLFALSALIMITNRITNIKNQLEGQIGDIGKIKSDMSSQIKEAKNISESQTRIQQNLREQELIQKKKLAQNKLAL